MKKSAHSTAVALLLKYNYSKCAITQDSYSFFFEVLILNITKFTEMLLTNRFYVDACLFSNRSQIMSKCGKNMKVVHELQSLIF